ncbi:MAG: hypothetical protein JXA28_05530 [Bacteroidetes bacterium]|nr:hypothetical protein [Bacteroidota bacterium]
MIRRILLPLLLFSAALPFPLPAQNSGIEAAQKDSVTAAGSARYLEFDEPTLPAAALRDSGPPVSGRLQSIGEDHIRLRRRDGSTAIPMSDITELRLPGGARSGRAMVHGLVLGAWFGNLGSWSDEAHPGSYLRIHPNNGAWLAGSIGFALATGCAAYLLGLLSDYTEECFRLGEDGAVDPSETERLWAHLCGYRHSRRLHLDVQLAAVYPVQSGRAKRILEDGGVYPGDYPPGKRTETTEEASTDLNLLRRLRLLYSFSSRLRAGIAYMDLTEPTMREYLSVDTDGMVAGISVAPEPRGIYLTAAYEPLYSRKGGTFEWLAGIGLGAGLVDGKLQGFRRGGIPPDAVNTDVSRPISGTLLSGMLFTELNMYLYSSLSLGITADFVFMAPLDVAPIAGINPSGSTFTFSSSSLGFVLGVHL